MNGITKKTPVSRLLEYAALHKLYTHFQLVKDGTGTHNPEFVYRVSIASEFELGSGRSKQEAKHKAAANMLRKLNLMDTQTEEEEGENELDIKENYIGELKQYCIDNHHPEVKYYLEEDSGPAHCKIFKMVCCVSQLKDHGISKTKKQAKQLAAFKMLQRLKNLVRENCSNISDSCVLELPKKRVIQSIPEIKIGEEEIFEKYSELKLSSSEVPPDPAAYYKDHPKAYLKLPEKSETLSSLLKVNVWDNYRAVDFAKEIAKELEVALTGTEIPLENSQLGNYFVLTMETIPPLAGLGSNENNAASDLLSSLLILCKS